MIWFSILTVVCIVNLKTVSGHGAMVKPTTWFDANGNIGMKSSAMCYAGCLLSPEKLCPGKPNSCDGFPYPGCSCMWYTNHTLIDKPTLFDPNLRTYPKSIDQQYYLHNPWRAPGFASVDSPCGVAGGNYKGCVGGCSHKQGGFGGGPKAETVDFGYKVAVTNWTRGDVVEVALGINANHGGGYSYRLCKLPDEGLKGLTEECFQKTPLEFVGDVQWAQYGEDESTRLEFPAVRVNEGTFPEGSQWTKNPISPCLGIAGGFYDRKPGCPKGTQFDPSKPALKGFGTNFDETVKPFPFSIVDKLRIPKDLEVGDYVLSFRWDCEQTPQVWNTCSSIKLE